MIGDGADAFRVGHRRAAEFLDDEAHWRAHRTGRARGRRDLPVAWAAVPSQKRQRQREGRAVRQAAAQAARRRTARRRQFVTAALIVALVVGLLALLSRGDEGEQRVRSTDRTTTTAAAAAPSKTGTAPCPAADGSSPRTTSFDGAPQMCIDPAKTYTARVETDVGAFTMSLDVKKAPKTVNNFVFLARYHFYDDVKFHRVVPGFVVQGGDAAKGDGTGDAGYKIAEEPPGPGEYKIGSVAMAKGSAPATTGSQFFVITGDQGVQLPAQYSLFGQVTEGLDVVKKIEADGAPDPQPPKVVHKMTKVTITEV
jgi:cyclophilin family peptidyl-prolyl cis-trans isomerase